jgi:hypothetical protein
MKPNYRHERLQRERGKKSKQQEKQQRREEESAKRKQQREGEGGTAEPAKPESIWPSS